MLDVKLHIQKRSSLKVEESIDIDIDIPSEHQLNDPIEIDKEEEPTQGAPPSKSKGK